jgi:hypothetical protein
MSWKDWNWYNIELKTAISRITSNLDNVYISESSLDRTKIQIVDKSFSFKNLKQLVDSCKNFNTNRPLKNSLISVKPEYHYC